MRKQRKETMPRIRIRQVKSTGKYRVYFSGTVHSTHDTHEDATQVHERLTKNWQETVDRINKSNA